MFKKIMNRSFWQGIVLAVMLVFAFLHTLDNIYPSAHALCPFGGLASLYSVITTGTFVHRVHASSIFLLLAVLLSAVLLGRVFCGWFCPLGTIGEWVYRAGRKLGIKKNIEITGTTAMLLKYLKYVVLGLIIYFAWTLGDLFYKGWCPWSAFMTLFEPGELIEDVLMGGIILGVIIGFSVFVERFWCRFLCPMGAAISIFNRFSLLKPVKAENCSNCKVCEKVCPVGIKLTEMKKINDSECIRCYKCLDDCPDNSVLTFNWKPLKTYQAGFLALLLFGGTIFITAQLGYWEKGRTFLDSSMGQIGGHGIDRLDENLAGIRGASSLQDIASVSGLSLETIYDIWNLPADYPQDSTLAQVMELTGLSRARLLEKLMD